MLFYIIAFILISVVLLFFDKTYRETTRYSDLTNRHNLVHSYFQNLSREINNAAIITPELSRIYNSTSNEGPFFVDSSMVIQQVNLLKSTVRDSVNIRIVGQLEKIITSELSWLLNSNVPDSLINHKAAVHIALFKTTDSLLNKGIERTNFLIEYRKEQLNREITYIRIWAFIFILLAGSLLIYTTVNLFQQQSKRLKKEKEMLQILKEVADYKYALDESSIVAITDQKGIIKYANENFCKISKYTEEELIGQDHRIINSGYHSKDFIKHLWKTIANGQIWKGELKNKAKDGSIYWVDTTIIPFLDEKGKPYQYIAIRSDITGRKEIEEKLIRSEKIYKTIASSIPGSVICLLDHEYRYLLIEGDMLEKLGYSKGKLLNNKAADVLPPEIFEDVEPQLKRVLAGEAVARESNRSGYDVISRFIPLRDENNQVYAIMIVAIDITDLKNAQRDIAELNRDLEAKVMDRTAELQAVNKELESFSYSVSHDLRAPLRAINGYADILKEDYTTVLDDEGKRLLSAIETNAKNMGLLIDDLLAFSRLGRKEVQKTNVNMKALAKSIASDTNKMPEHKAIIQIGDLSIAQADPILISQVWANLLSNAIKYSAKSSQPHIEVQSEANNKEIIYSVKDNGVGFDMKYAHKLFGVFQRLHHRDEFEGTGVGLAIVERIITRHGGRVWAEATPGEGATFFFSLPIR